MTGNSGADGHSIERFGLEPEWVVQEFGYDDDVDFDLRDALEDITGTQLVDEYYDDVCDAAIVWWREGDDDLTDVLVDSLTVLEDGAAVWLLTPKAGRDGHVRHNEITEAATTAGLNATSSSPIAEDWTATKLVPRGRGR